MNLKQIDLISRNDIVWNTITVEMVKQNLFKIHQIENYKTYLKNKHKSNIGIRKRLIAKQATERLKIIERIS